MIIVPFQTGVQLSKKTDKSYLYSNASCEIVVRRKWRYGGTKLFRLPASTAGSGSEVAAGTVAAPTSGARRWWRASWDALRFDFSR